MSDRHIASGDTINISLEENEGMRKAIVRVADQLLLEAGPVKRGQEVHFSSDDQRAIYDDPQIAMALLQKSVETLSETPWELVTDNEADAQDRIRRPTFGELCLWHTCHVLCNQMRLPKDEVELKKALGRFTATIGVVATNQYGFPTAGAALGIATVLMLAARIGQDALSSYVSQYFEEHNIRPPKPVD
ncbi:MAG TPA: hypothetical protein VGL56_02890 [Fimbriimonadaceae bacterium]|jgi:hypothetical protein